MEFEQKEEVDENEIDALGIKKKDDDHLDDGLVDAIGDDTVVDPDLVPDEEKDVDDETILGVDKDIVDYMFSQSDHE